MKIQILTVGPLAENCIILSFDNQCIIFDPGDEEENIISFIKKERYKPLSILNTHGHFDHIGAVKQIQTTFSIPFYLHSADEPLIQDTIQSILFGTVYIKKPTIDNYLEDKQTFNFKNVTIKVLHTPGHTKGSVCFYIEEGPILISGDTLFYSSIGRTDLPGGNFNDMIKSIKTKLLILPDDTKVYPGHGAQTTIGFEKQNNPFLTQ